MTSRVCCDRQTDRDGKGESRKWVAIGGLRGGVDK
jgi:hypothetical protein